MNPVLADGVDTVKALVQAVNSSAARAKNNPGARCQLTLDDKTRLGDGFVRRDQRKLGKSIVKGQLLPGKLPLRLKVLDLAGNPDRQALRSFNVKFRYPAVAIGHGLERFRNGTTQAIDRSLAGDGHAMHGDLPVTFKQQVFNRRHN